jgi:hypothetical protein
MRGRQGRRRARLAPGRLPVRVKRNRRGRRGPRPTRPAGVGASTAAGNGQRRAGTKLQRNSLRRSCRRGVCETVQHPLVRHPLGLTSDCVFRSSGSDRQIGVRWMRDCGGVGRSRDVVDGLALDALGPAVVIRARPASSGAGRGAVRRFPSTRAGEQKSDSGRRLGAESASSRLANMGARIKYMQCWAGCGRRQWDSTRGPGKFGS